MANDLDYKLKLGYDASELEKGHKEAIKKMVKVQNTLTKLYRTELTILKKGTSERQSQLAVMQQQLRLQQKINSLQGKATQPSPGSGTSPRKPTRGKVDPDSRVSYQARTTLQEKLSRGMSKDYSVSVTDPKLLNQIKVAQSRLRQLKAELNDTKSFKALARIRADYAEIQREISGAVRNQKELNRSMQRGTVVGGKFASTAKSFALSFASAYAVMGAGKEIFRIGKEFDAMQAGLLAASDNAKAAEENFTFLMDTAKRLGTDVESGVRGFNRLGVSMRGAGFEAEEIKEVFSGIQEATATFQLSADKSNLVMLAMSQMASKGKISSEELRLLTPYTAMCM